MRTPHLFALVASLALAPLGCGEPSTPPPASPTADAAPPPSPAPETHAPAPDVEEPPRRSEPPPRAALPAGVSRIDKDVIALALSGDGVFLVAGDLAGNALLWDLDRGRFLWRDPTPVGNRLGRVAISEYGGIYVAGSFDEPDRPMRAWSAATQERRGEYGEAGTVALDVALDREGRRAAVLSSSADGASQRVAVWPIGGDKPLLDVAVPTARRGVITIDPAGELVAVADDAGRVTLFGPDALRRELVPASTDPVPRRWARLVFAAPATPGAAPTVLWAAADAAIASVPLEVPAEVAARPAEVRLAEDGSPIRGLHRLSDGRVVAVTRPEAGGLVFWGTDGKIAGELVTDCRCETHALAANGARAACGCTPASEIRHGAPRWVE